MAVKTVYVCDISGRESDNLDDVIIFSVLRSGEETTSVVMEDIVREALDNDDEELLSRIMFRDE